RPARFRALLDRYAAPAPGPQEPQTGAEIGLRTAEEVALRRARMIGDAAAPRISADAREGLETLMAIAGPLPEAQVALRALVPDMPAIAAPLSQLHARIKALETVGIDPATLTFEVTYGRTSMEYYDGFVFGFTANGSAPVATGGRYDALTLVLGQGRHVPAVGGVIRPDLVAALKAAP
ncbi:MAG: ATP phosphoribosyltransferase regulatory subunit, partial [Pseudomonadota bacterium]